MHVEKQLGDFNLRVDLELENEITGILGYSGCGKTMTLKMIAGLMTPDKGKIILNNRVLFDSEKKINLRPQVRKVGLLFQSYALFDHMTVYQNIAIAMRVPKKVEGNRVNQYLKLLDLEQVKDQKPKTLSGGQKQRTALARLLAQQPDILLLDEPFSALDNHLIFKLEKEFKEVLQAFQGTVIYISHNRHEIYKYCDQTAVMSKGKIVEIKATQQLFERCQTLTAAQLTGCRNIIPITSCKETAYYSAPWQLILKEVYPKIIATHIGIREGDIEIKPLGEEALEIQVKIENVFHMPDKVKIEGRTLADEKLIYTCSNREFEKIKPLLKAEQIAFTVDPNKILLLRA